jgi:hypothetical protein
MFKCLASHHSFRYQPTPRPLPPPAAAKRCSPLAVEAALPCAVHRAAAGASQARFAVCGAGQAVLHPWQRGQALAGIPAAHIEVARLDNLQSNSGQNTACSAGNKRHGPSSQPTITAEQGQPSVTNHGSCDSSHCSSLLTYAVAPSRHCTAKGSGSTAANLTRDVALVGTGPRPTVHAAHLKSAPQHGTWHV